MIDMNMVNSATDIISFLEQIGMAGRHSYRVLLCLDYVLISTLLLLSTTMLFRLILANKLSTGFDWLILLPLGRGLFDVLETSSMLANVSTYPGLLQPLLWLVVFSTPAKWAFFYANIAAVIILAALLIVTKLRPKRV
jgi:hypothetical protein